MTVKYLITGATGGLGSQVLAHLAASVPHSSLVAASSKESNRAQFEAQGIAFRVTNFDDPASLKAAFDGVENLFFVSTNTFDNERRTKQHWNVVEAAKKTGVKHVCFHTILFFLMFIMLMRIVQTWYTSLAFGGLRSDSKMAVQQAHLETEKMLEKSVPATCLRFVC
jgi:hypothetical protein